MKKKRKRRYSPEQKATWFMIRVAEGMAGWTSFAQATFMSPVYSEALTYRPIFEIARPRPWKTRPQKKLVKRKRKVGRNQTVDFVFQSADGTIGIFLEVKFIRKKAKHCAQITKDVHKLALLNAKDVSEKKPPTNVFKYILLIGTEKDIPARIELFAKKLGPRDLGKLSYTEDTRLFSQVQSAFNNKIRNSTGYAWAFPGVGKDVWKYWAVLLKEQQWWNDLAKLKGKLVEDDEGEAEDDDFAKIEDDIENDIDV